MSRKPTAWRCKNAQQQRDKNEIYQSREWANLRVAKFRANPLCELCLAEGIIQSTQAIHHKHPIEDSSTMDEMRKWAFMWDNLQSVCRYHHAKIHQENGSNTKEVVKQRAEARHARWKESLMSRFTAEQGDEAAIQPTS